MRISARYSALCTGGPPGWAGIKCLPSWKAQVLGLTQRQWKSLWLPRDEEECLCGVPGRPSAQTPHPAHRHCSKLIPTFRGLLYLEGRGWTKPACNCHMPLYGQATPVSVTAHTLQAGARAVSFPETPLQRGIEAVCGVPAHPAWPCISRHRCCILYMLCSVCGVIAEH